MIIPRGVVQRPVARVVDHDHVDPWASRRRMYTDYPEINIAFYALTVLRWLSE